MRWASILRTVLVVSLAGAWVAVAEVRVEGPATAKAGSVVEITVTGSTNQLDFVSIVPAGSAEGKYDAYDYVRGPGAIKLTAPAAPGAYEIRVLGAATPYPTLAKRALVVEGVTATLEAPAQVEAGAAIEVRWTGPANPLDYVAIGDAARPYLQYAYTKAGNPAKLTAPDEPGSYELRYFLGQGDTVIGRRAITVGGVAATLSAPAEVKAGETFSVTWTGPGNPRDFITLVEAGAPAKEWAGYAYTSKGSPLELVAPDRPGKYELRYLTGQSYATVASAPVEVAAVTASLRGPAEAVAGTAFEVRWEGPGHERDYVTVVRKGDEEGESGNYAYTMSGNPVKVDAPLEPGDYELRYSTGQSHLTLARSAIRITPGKETPGFVSVTVADAAAAGGAIEIILDASGSMLQRLGNERRIDIARRTLTQLVTTVIPAGTPFALRAFGREVDSCQTDLEVAIGPLDRAAVSARIGKLEAKNGAKTPIGASLEKVADDLKTVRGERLVILITDGEETCGGDPAVAIEKLRAAGIDVRVNIVGFAIDDARLAATFRHWADLGNGAYFDADDADGLTEALSRATQPGVELIDAGGRVVAKGVAGGEPLTAMPGTYTVRLSGSDRAQQVSVKAGETSAVRF